jgi:hypothetical protein
MQCNVEFVYKYSTLTLGSRKTMKNTAQAGRFVVNFKNTSPVSQKTYSVFITTTNQPMRLWEIIAL